MARARSRWLVEARAYDRFIRGSDMAHVLARADEVTVVAASEVS